MRDDEIAQLESRFCPPLDASLVLAISCDEGQTYADAESALTQLAGSVPSGAADAADAAVVDQVLRDWRVFDSDMPPPPPPPAAEPPHADPTLAFLCNMLPDTPRDVLERALADAGGDVDGAIDEVLAAQFIEGEKVSGAGEAPPQEGAAPEEPAASSRGGLDLAALEHGLSSGRQRRAKGRKTKPVTVSLTSGSRESDTPAPAAAKVPTTDAELAQQLQDDERAALDAGEPSIEEQQWLLTSSTLAHLGTLLGMPHARVQSLFNNASFNLHVAVARAIDAESASAAGAAAAEAPEFETVCETLAAISGHAVRDVRPVLAAVRGSDDAALDLLQLRDTVTEKAAARRPDALDPLGRTMGRVAPTAVPTAPAPAPAPAAGGDAGGGPRASAAAEAMRAGALATVLPASAAHVPLAAADDEVLSMRECRARADECTARRNMLLRSATSAARAHRGTYASGAAMVYADEARAMHDKARVWQARAADAAARERLDPGEVDAYIDLHELSVHEALTVVQEGVRRWAAAPLPAGRERRAPLAIVTGRGAHSRNNASVLRPAVARMLVQRGLVVDADTDAGQLLVRQRR